MFGRGAKTERRSDVETEGTTVLVAQKMIVPWVDSQLAASSTEVFLEEMTVLAPLADDTEQGTQTGQAKRERFTEISVAWNTTVY